MNTAFDPKAAEAFLKEAARLLGTKTESPLRHVLSSHLPRMFPGDDLPWWVRLHAEDAEKRVRTERSGASKTGFIDTLVGSTAVEYEKDLADPKQARHGEEQVREYCAGLLNQGIPSSNIVGVLSDTLRWRAYAIADVKKRQSGEASFGPDHVALSEIESIDLSEAGPLQAKQLGAFLLRHFGRVGSRLLSADSLAADLGFESRFCIAHLDDLRVAVRTALKTDPHSDLIKHVWSNFVAFLGGSDTSGAFDEDTYTSELYLLALAKLLCANVLEGKALLSSDDELERILTGSFFKERGFANLVEYDYFGWLTKHPFIDALLPIARNIQCDLAPYDFGAPPTEDLFGRLMAQLARRSRRLLLGQEWTPSWLARKVVSRVLSRLPKADDPHLVDMCCGSGSMVVEAVKQARERLETLGVSPSPESLLRLSRTITGFDIDPLAVMLSKVSWILAAREWISKSGAFDISIPIYHADSLFASTPVSRKISSEGTELHQLDLDGRKLSIPDFLLSAKHAGVFDSLVLSSYTVAMETAQKPQRPDVSSLATQLLERALGSAELEMDSSRTRRLMTFAASLLETLDELQRSGRNGIWAFLLSNSYRPALVAAQFNGLVSNPPWLAMSKVADNPYKNALLSFSEMYGVKPPGASHLHTELATIFLLRAVARYLTDGAQIGCVLPESITSALHHEPFRNAAYLTAIHPVDFIPNELWMVARGTFKNEAVVMFGQKSRKEAPLAAFRISEEEDLPISIRLIGQGDRTAWSEDSGVPTHSDIDGPVLFKQGADVFPRTVIFHEVAARGERVDLTRIDRAHSRSAYLVKEAKKQRDFSITAKGVDARYMFDVLLSNHLTPFDVLPPARALLPLKKVMANWVPASTAEIGASGPSTKAAFDAFFKGFGGDFEDCFAKLDTDRKKLSNQMFPSSGLLVVMGAGGQNVCAAAVALAAIDSSRLIVDQTLYWAVFSSEDEALYWVGTLNSEAINRAIRRFQPKGQFGPRHVHTLPLQVVPPFDPTNAAHRRVVTATRNLRQEWEALKQKAPEEFSDLLDPNRRLPTRRTELKKRIAALSGHSEYEAACDSLFGAGKQS